MPLTLVIIFFFFIAALIWLINWEPDNDNGVTGTKDDKEKLEGDIKKLFTEMQMDARTYNREEFVPTLAQAQSEVMRVLKDHKLVA